MEPGGVTRSERPRPRPAETVPAKLRHAPRKRARVAPAEVRARNPARAAGRFRETRPAGLDATRTARCAPPRRRIDSARQRARPPLPKGALERAREGGL